MVISERRYTQLSLEQLQSWLPAFSFFATACIGTAETVWGGEKRVPNLSADLGLLNSGNLLLVRMIPLVLMQWYRYGGLP